MKHKQIEKDVLGVYKRVSPSFIDIEDTNKFEKTIRSKINILYSLGLCPQFFKNKKIIEIGGGTGEQSLCYALWGGEVTIMEPNEISCRRAKSIYERCGQEVTVIQDSLFQADLSILANYDVLICEGVLQHTYDPSHGLSLILEAMAFGTVAIISIAESHGWFKRDLQRRLVRSLSDGSEADIRRVSKLYFQKHIDRAVKFGLRSEETVIYDTYVNPQILVTPLSEICRRFLENHIFHLGSYPSLHSIITTSPWNMERENAFDYAFYNEYYSFIEKVWATSGEENVEGRLCMFNDASQKEVIERDYEAIENLNAEINAGASLSDDITLIQNGYLGIGMNYFYGVKHNEKYYLNH